MAVSLLPTSSRLTESFGLPSLSVSLAVTSMIKVDASSSTLTTSALATGAKFDWTLASTGSKSTLSNAPSPSQSRNSEQAVPAEGAPSGATPVSDSSSTLSLSSSMSALLPSPSPSVSTCSPLSSGKASDVSGVLSLSSSGSQASPCSSPSLSHCRGLNIAGQLSLSSSKPSRSASLSPGVGVSASSASRRPLPSASGSELSPMPSPSVSVSSFGSLGKASLAFSVPSPSLSGFGAAGCGVVVIEPPTPSWVVDVVLPVMAFSATRISCTSPTILLPGSFGIGRVAGSCSSTCMVLGLIKDPALPSIPPPSARSADSSDNTLSVSPPEFCWLIW